MNLLDRFKSADQWALSRAITLVEAGDPEGQALLREVYARGGRARIYGITGMPGAGKSTLLRNLASVFRRRGDSVAIVACDPTSSFTGGALLGDRVRMGALFDDKGVFMRSLASRGHLGGLSLAAASVITLLDAFGFNVVLVETVGIGQSEVEISEFAHTTLVVLSPGFGDEIQASKAGVLEIADVYVVNKADLDGADAAVKELQERLQFLGANRARDAAADTESSHVSWLPPIVKAIATRGVGVEEIADRLVAHGYFLATSGRLKRQSRNRAERQLRDLVSVLVARKIIARAEMNGDLEQMIEAIEARETDPYSAARYLLSCWFP